MAEPACGITRYDCSNEEHQKKIKELIDAANDQQAKDAGFKDIFPWLGGCDLAPRHYVAQRADGTICGWMTVTPREWKGTNYLYLSEISAIRIQDESFRGVGKRLHDQLVEDAKKENMAFIYLYPLNDSVKNTYIGKWGYKELYPGDKEHEHLYFTVKSKPSEALKMEIKPKDMPRIYTARAYRYASEPTRDEALIALISKTRRTLLAKPELVQELKDVLDTVDLYESMEGAEEVPSLEDRRKMIADVFAKATGGGKRRKTRRLRKRKLTRRKRN